MHAMDDRGRVVQLHPALTWSRVMGRLRARDTSDTAIRASVGRIRRGFDWIPYLLSLTVGVGVLVLLPSSVPGVIRHGLGIGIVVFGTLVVDPWLWRDRLQSAWEEIVHEFLDRGSYPCCGHSLAGLPAAEDGCITCSECGAAWKKQRIGEEPRAGTPPASHNRH